MQLNDAKNLALELMKQHGLLVQGWRFEFDNAKRRLGACKHRGKIISLSNGYVRLNDVSVIRNTILHEIAHALVGAGHGHDYVWRRKALEIGCNGHRTAKDVSAPESKYEATCPACGHIHKRHRISQNTPKSSCGACSNTFNPNTVLVWVQKR